MGSVTFSPQFFIKLGCHLRNMLRNSLHKQSFLLMQNFVVMTPMVKLMRNYVANYSASTVNGNPLSTVYYEVAQHGEFQEEEYIASLRCPEGVVAFA